jgi:hypothetical protein
MIRTALLLCAGLLAALCFACVQQQPFVGPTATCDPSPFLAKAFLLAPGFKPQATGHNYQPPQPAAAVDPKGNIGQDLASAYCLADPLVQQQLLRLTSVFINQDVCTPAGACGSWGYRERPDQQPGTGRYIALSATLWPDSSSPAIHYSVYENARLSDLLAWPSVGGPTYTPSTGSQSDSSGMTVLAALAHEYGHVLWYDVMKVNGNYNFNNLCGGDFFQFWLTKHPPKPWRHFQNRGNRKVDVVIDKHRYPPQIKDIDAAIERNDLPTAIDGISQLYSTLQPWASFLGAVSVDEDFVETFTLDTLDQAAVQGGFVLTLPLKLSNTSAPDIQNDYFNGNKGDLLNKAACIVDALPAPSLLKAQRRLRGRH